MALPKPKNGALETLIKLRDKANNNVVTQGVLEIMRGIPLGIASTASNVVNRSLKGDNLHQVIGEELVVNPAKATINQLNNVSKDLGAGLALNGETGERMRSSQQDAINMADKAMEQARKTSDPQQKARLIKVAQDTLNTVSQGSQDITSSFSEDVNQNPVVRGFQTGANVAGIAAMTAPLAQRGVTAYKNSPLSSEEGFIRPDADVGSNPPMGSYTRTKTGKLVSNENPKKPTYAQNAPEYPPTERLDMPKANKPVPVPDTPAKPKQANLNTWEKMTQQVNGIDRYELPPSYTDRAVKEATDKAIMQKDIKGNTFNQILKNITPAKEKVWKEGMTIARNDPQLIDTRTQVQPYLEKSLDKLVAEGMITPDQKATALTRYLNNVSNVVNKNLYDIPATAYTKPINFEQPMTMEQLFNAKTGANKLSRAAWDSAGGVKANLNTQQQINLALADGMDEAVTAANPALKAATEKYAAMMRIEPNITSALRNQSLKLGSVPVPFTGAARQVLGSAMQGNLPGLIGVGVPSVSAGLIAASALGLPQKLADTLADKFGYERKGSENDIEYADNIGKNNQGNGNLNNPENYNHGTLISQTMDDVKPDQNGHYTVADPFLVRDANGSSLALSDKDYLDQQSKLNAMKKDPQYIQNPYFKNDVDQQLSTLESKHKTSEKLGQYHQVASDINSKIIDARNRLKNAPPNLLSLFPNYDKLRVAENGKYRALAEDLKYIEAQWPSASLFIPQTTDSAKAALDIVNQQMIDKYNKSLLQYTGGSVQPANQSTVNQLPAGQTNLPAPTSQGLGDIQQGSGLLPPPTVPGLGLTPIGQ